MAAGWRDMPLAQLDRLILFEIVARADGSVDDNDLAARAREVLAFAREHHIAVDVAFSVQDEAVFNRLFGEARARRELARQCERWLGMADIGGVHLDVEGYAPAEKASLAGFREWLADVDRRRKAAGKALSAFFPADDRFAPYDRANVPRVDYWVAQIYDAHSADSKSTGPLVTRSHHNPVAIPRALARLSALHIARSNVLLSIPLYGWEWRASAAAPGAKTEGQGRLLTYAETPARLMPDDRKVATDLARQHGLHRDAEHSPYYSYANEGAWMQGWYEDMESLTHKLAPERGRGYGLAFFPLGYDRNAIVEPFLRWWRSSA